jgi:RNA 2',3'-cyclic 3'-phosphodiesterase
MFVAIDLPDEVKDLLEPLCHGVPGARWMRDRQFHLTLRFLGEVEGPVARAITESLHAVRSDPFELALAGTGHFPPRGDPRVLWAGVSRSPELLELHRQVEKVMRRAGLPPEARKFAAHVTLARLHAAPLPRVLEWLREHATLRSEPFLVDGLQLFRSVLGHDGAQHVLEASYPLFPGRPGPAPCPEADLPPGRPLP